MILKNMILIADNDVTMALYGIKNGNKYRYNFKSNSWDSDTIIDADKLTTVNDFRVSALYANHCKDKLIGWSIINPRQCKRLAESNQEIKCSRDIILSISISIS